MCEGAVEGWKHVGSNEGTKEEMKKVKPKWMEDNRDWGGERRGRKK